MLHGDPVVQPVAAHRSDVSLGRIVEEMCGHPEARASDWCVERSTDPTSGWIRIHRDRTSTPEQGWKLHVSATVASAEAVLRRALPVLLAEDASFKIAASLRVLEILNQGHWQISQIGKFITVYPNDDGQAVRLAVALDLATRGMLGPVVPSDRPLNPDSLVHYRYGSFGDRWVQTPVGDIISIILGPMGVAIPDERQSSFSPPDWVVDPFVQAGVAAALPTATPLIGGHYLIVSLVHQSPSGAVYLAADLESSRPCVLKRRGRAATAGADGRDARDRLRHEAAVLARLAPDRLSPTAFELIEQGSDLFLAMEDVVGETLDHQVNRLLEQGRCVPVEQVLAWGRELTARLMAIHAAGFAYRDLKPSNVMVTTEGPLRLIDFELAHEVTRLTDYYDGGTRGYVSAEQVSGRPPTAQDDVYALGALLYYLITGAEPPLAPRAFNLQDRPLVLMNPASGPALDEVIGRCLDLDLSRRFATMAEVDRALAEASDSPSTVPPAFGGEPSAESEEDARRGARDLARRLGDTLCQVGQTLPDGKGVAWLSPRHPGRGLLARDLNSGGAGTVLVLAELVAAFGDPAHCNVLAEGARWLAVAPRPGGPPVPGLYVGDAGVGAALLRAGQVLANSELVAAAAERARLIASLPYTSPDLFSGTAGRIRFLLLLWDETGEPMYLREARAAGESLLAVAENVAPTELCWRIPDGFAGQTGKAYLGYAHGAAGIADVLLDLFAASADQRFLVAAQRAGRWLAHLAVPTLPDGSGLNWPSVEGAKAEGAFWCHGATGVGQFFLHAAELDALPEAPDLAARAAGVVARGTRWAGATQCHGLAGNIEFLLNVYQWAGDRTYLAEARSLARLLDAFGVVRDGWLVWPSEDPTIFAPDYMVGYAGVASCLLRLADPDRRPPGLSRRGFRYQPTVLPKTS